MAPKLIIQEEITIACPPVPPIANAPSEQTANSVWIVPTLVVGTIFTVITFIILYLRRKNSRVLYHQACEKDPQLSRKDYLRRRRMNTIERLAEDELQRLVLIREALGNKRKKLLEDSESISTV
jgi:uncharacterized membrane protein